MTDRIAEIEARAKAATEGPWEASDWSRDGGDFRVTIETNRPEVLEPGQSGIWPNGIMKLCIASTESGENPLRDADFIAHARSDIPYLISQVRALQERDAEIARMKEHEADYVARLDAMQFVINQAGFDQQKLRERAEAAEAALREINAEVKKLIDTYPNFDDMAARYSYAVGMHDIAALSQPKEPNHG